MHAGAVFVDDLHEFQDVGGSGTRLDRSDFFKHEGPPVIFENKTKLLSNS